MRARVLAGLFVSVAIAAFATSACDSDDDTGGGGGGTDAGSQTDATANGDGARPGDPDGGSQGDATNGSDASGDASTDADTGSMTLTSTAFAHGGVIPVIHSVCDGANESIPLAWTGAPGGVASYAIVMRDLTLGGANDYHWVLYDVPTSVTSLAQDIPKDTSPNPPGGGAKQTRWSFGSDTGYQGMCPIAGPTTHTYELSVYAIDVATLPGISDAQDPGQVDAAIQAHEIAYGRLQGSYTKQ